MATETTAGDIQEEHSAVTEQPESDSVVAAQFDSEDVSLDELMMDAEDESSPNSAPPQPVSEAEPIAEENSETERVEAWASPEMPESEGVMEEGETSTGDNAPSLSEAADGPQSVEDVDEKASEEQSEPEPVEVDEEVVPNEAMAAVAEITESASESDLQAVLDSTLAELAEVSEVSEPSPEVARTPNLDANGASIGAKSGDTSPLPALDPSAGRPAPAVQTPIPPSLPAPAAPLGGPPELALSAMDEDEDDAVTQIGLSLHELEAPQASEAPYLPSPAPRFQQSRSAATVVVSRVDTSLLPGGPTEAPGAGMVGRLFGQKPALPPFGSPNLPPPSSPSLAASMAPIWPKLSWGLFAAGIFALVGVLATRNSPADPGKGQAVQALQANQEVAAPSGAPVQPAVAKTATRAGGGRTAVDRLAQEEGQVARNRRAFELFVQEIKSGAEVPRRLERFTQFAADSSTRIAVFRELASWSSTEGPDVMYALWAKAQGGSESADLAFELLYTADQRGKASSALGVVLDLRKARSCEDYQAILPRVVKHADRRALLSLRPLVHEDGCGDDGTEDCYACLRGSDFLAQGLAAAQAKAPPVL